jgi:AmmeMemoRadiSam system protein A
VCLKKDGQLRGCIGTIQPATGSLAEEIRDNAISSATRDPRFEPVSRAELDQLTYSVDVLGEPEDIPDMSYLDPKVYGVIVRSRARSGLLLPDLEGVDTAEEQVRIATMKAGIGPGEPVELQRFKVTRHE